jgi:hypothetical protein
MKLSPVVLGAGGLLAFGLLLVASAGGTTRQITEPSELASIDGERFVVLVFNPSDPEADPAVARFLDLEEGDVTFLAISANVVQAWESLADIQVEHRTALVAVDTVTDRTRQFTLGAGLEHAVAEALAFLDFTMRAEVVGG